jgi:hypothetical protein
MKAVAVFPGNKQFKVIRDFPEPRIESLKQIKVRMLDVGICGTEEPMTVDTSLFMRNHVLKNQVIFGTVNAGPDAFKSAIADIAEFHRRWPDAIRAIITNGVPIDDAEQPLAGKVPGIKNVISVAQ